MSKGREEGGSNEEKCRGRKLSSFFFFFPKAGMQVLSLRLMTSKLVSLVAQVTLHLTALRPVSDISLLGEKKKNKESG